MAYSLRLPDALDTAARVRADYLGISLNALVCVALDAYLRGSAEPEPVPDKPAPGEDRSPQARPAKPAQATGRPSKTSPVRPQPEEPQSLPAANPLSFTRAERREFTRLQRAERKSKR